MVADQFYIGIKGDLGWLSEKTRISPTSDGKRIYEITQQVFQSQWNGEGIHQVQVTALNPRELKHQQLDLFSEPVEERNAVNEVTDKINQRYGEFTIAPVSIMDRSTMPNVISPAWRPAGHRKTI